MCRPGCRTYLVEQLPYCDLLRLSPLTGWFVLSARQVVRRIGLWSCCCSFKGRVFSRERESSAFFIWPSHQRPATPVLSFGLEKKSKVVADQLLPFWALGVKKILSCGRPATPVSDIWIEKIFQLTKFNFLLKVVTDQLLPFWTFGLKRFLNLTKPEHSCILHGCSGFFYLNFFDTTSNIWKKNVGGGIKKNWRWCQIFVKNLCQESLSRIFVKNLCQIMKLAFFYGGGGIFLEAEASFFRRRRRT